MANIAPDLYSQLVQAASDEGYSESELRDVLTQRGHKIESSPSPAPQAQTPAFLPGMASPGMPQPHPAILGAVKKVTESEQFPAAVGALGAGLMTGGMGAIPAAATIGLGAGGAEAYRQVFAGGEPTSSEAAQKIGFRGLEGALTELGAKGATSIVKNLGPNLIGLFQKIPTEATKRIIARWEDMSPVLKAGMGNQSTVEKIGVDALRKSQTALEVARRNAGLEVEKALGQFQSAVNGQKVVDAKPIADALERVLQEGQVGDEAVAAAIPQREISKLRRISESILTDPKGTFKTPKEAVALRRAIDDLIAFKKGGAMPVQSSLGQRAAKEMASAMRDSISQAASANNFTALADANSKFSEMARLYDEIGPVIATRGRGDIQLLDRLKKVGNMYFDGGLSRDALEAMASSIPGGDKAVNTMLDAASMRALAVEPKTSPSSLMMNAMRFLGSPRIVGGGIRAAYTIKPVMRPAGVAGMSAIDAAARMNRQ